MTEPSAWPVIRTHRTTLRLASLADLSALDAAVAHPSFPQDLPLVRMRRQGTLSQWLEKLCADEQAPKLWSMTLGTGEHCVGMVALVPEMKPGDWWLSYWLAPDHWGQGIAREGVSALLSATLARPEYTSIIAMVSATNESSIALLRAIGFGQTTNLSSQASVPEGHIAFTLSAPH